MRLRLNGEAREVPEGLSLAGLLSQLGIGAPAVVAERNGSIVVREAFGTTKLRDGDVLEILRIVGGG